MTVRVDRSFAVDAPPEAVWEFIADPEKRARSISVVTDFSTNDPEVRIATWQVKLPLPLITRTVSIDTEDLVRRPPEYVEFVGRSKLLDVRGEHTIVETDGGSTLQNVFIVDGHVPGVERFFKRNLDTELENLQRELEADLARTNR